MFLIAQKKSSVKVAFMVMMIPIPNREGRLTWLIVLALQRADTPQRETLERCYGTGSEQDAQRVREVYDKLNLAKTFRSGYNNGVQ